MCSYCGENCEMCGFKEKCNGCKATCGNPFGDGCLAAEYIKLGGTESFNNYKKALIDEINALNISGMPKLEDLNCLAGFYVNLAYPMPSGNSVKLLKDNRIYLGNQLPCIFDDGEGKRCFGIVADNGFILVCQYGENGVEPEIVLFKHR